MKRYIVMINGDKVGYSKKKKIANYFINGYYASNKDVICSVVKSKDVNDNFIKDPDNEIVQVERIYLPRKYEEAYLIDFCDGEIKSLMRDIEELIVNKFISNKERRYLMNAALSIANAINEEDLYVPSIKLLQESSERIAEWRYAFNSY